MLSLQALSSSLHAGTAKRGGPRRGFWVTFGSLSPKGRVHLHIVDHRERKRDVVLGGLAAEKKKLKDNASQQFKQEKEFNNYQRWFLGCRKKGCVKGAVILRFCVCSRLSAFARVCARLPAFWFPFQRARNAFVCICARSLAFANTPFYYTPFCDTLRFWAVLV